jgi:transitional endoplasmic reticulum ATPase
MGGSDSPTLLDSVRQSLVFDGFKEHSNSPRVSTQLTVLDLLRKTHPEFHVTYTSPSKCDLLGFAKAGHATVTLDESDESYDATRLYSSGGPRLDKKPGFLRDQVRFGRVQYCWDGKEYLVYEVEYLDPYGRSVRLFYVLSPRMEIGVGQRKHDDTDKLLIAVGKWSTDLHDEIYVFDDGFWAKNKELWTAVQDCSWDEVILNQKMKDNLIADVQGFFDNRELYKKLAVPWKRGLILHGVPGNGKTISIKALISELSARADPVPSLYVKSFDACQGQKFSIRSIFTQARVMAPCLLIFEDLDSLVTDKTRSYFLNEVDGLESNDGILMIGSTNHLDSLDPAISKRPSRFDRKYHFKLPNEEERTAYCQFWRKKLVDNHLVDFQEELCPLIAKLSDGFSFAYLKELFVIALLTIARGASGAVLDEEEEEDSAPDLSDDGKSSILTNEPVLVEHEEAIAETTEVVVETATTATTVSQKPAEAKSAKKRTLPEVEIPEHLKENVLLKMIKAQLKILLDEMDNTPEEQWPSSKDQSGGVSCGAPVVITRRMGKAIPMPMN